MRATRDGAAVSAAQQLAEPWAAWGEGTAPTADGALGAFLRGRAAVGAAGGAAEAGRDLAATAVGVSPRLGRGAQSLGAMLDRCPPQPLRPLIPQLPCADGAAPSRLTQADAAARGSVGEQLEVLAAALGALQSPGAGLQPGAAQLAGVLGQACRECEQLTDQVGGLAATRVGRALGSAATRGRPGSGVAGWC